MSAVVEVDRTDAIVLRLRPVIDMTDGQLFDFCQINRDLRIERTAEGELIVMTPAESETSRRNLNIGTMLDTWSKRDGSGQHPEIREEPDQLEGGEVLPGFVLALTGIWAKVL